MGRRVVPNTSRMVTVELVINSIRLMHIRVTISCRYCIAFEVMLLFLVFFVCQAPSPEHLAFEQALRCRLLPDFEAVFSVFSQKLCNAAFSRIA